MAYNRLTEGAFKWKLARDRADGRAHAVCARAPFICKYGVRHYTTILGPPSRAPSFVHKLSLSGGLSWEFFTLLFS